MAKGFNLNLFFKKNEKTILIGVAVVVVLFFFGFFDKIMGSLSCGHKLVEGFQYHIGNTSKTFGSPSDCEIYMKRLYKFCLKKAFNFGTAVKGKWMTPMNLLPISEGSRTKFIDNKLFLTI